MALKPLFISICFARRLGDDHKPPVTGTTPLRGWCRIGCARYQQYWLTNSFATSSGWGKPHCVAASLATSSA